MRQKLNDAKNAFTRAIKDQGDQNKELSESRKEFMKELDSAIEEKEKAGFVCSYCCCILRRLVSLQ